MGHRFLGALTRGPYRKFSGSRPPSRLRNRGLALPVLALLAALSLGLLFMLPGNPLHAQEATTELDDYAENGTDPVVTFTAVDPEGRTVYWSLPTTPPDPPVPDGFVAADFTDSDAAHFKISMDGVLIFRSPPNYENPMGGTENTNTYNVVVASSDDAPGAGAMIMMAYHKVTVMVTDEDEDGGISLSALQPQVDVSLTATLTDPDARSVTAMPIINAKWKWEQAPAMDGTWTLIPGAGDGATAADATTKASDAYSPAEETAGMYLRATVTYTDKHGDDKTAMAVSANMVRAMPSGTNSAPRSQIQTTLKAERWTKTRPPAPQWGSPSRLLTPLARY